MPSIDVRALLEERDVVFAPGAWDGLSARLIEQAGFDAVCSSGFAISASLGMPDIEIYTATENVAAIGRIREATTLPIISDIDTGYGNAVNVMRTVRAAEQAGATALFMEDQEAPKRCPICVGEPVAVIPMEEAVGKIRAAADAKSERTVLIARCDANGDEALRRLEAYREAGADLLMPVTKTFSTVEEWANASKRLGGVLVATLTASTWVEQEFTLEVLREIGVRIALLPTQPIIAAAGALRSTLSRLRAEPAADVTKDAELSHNELIGILGFEEAIGLQEKYMPSSVAVEA